MIWNTESSSMVIAWTSEPFEPKNSFFGVFGRSPGHHVHRHPLARKHGFGVSASTTPTVLPFFGLLFWAWKVRTCSAFRRASWANLLARIRVTTLAVGTSFKNKRTSAEVFGLVKSSLIWGSEGCSSVQRGQCSAALLQSTFQCRPLGQNPAGTKVASSGVSMTYSHSGFRTRFQNAQGSHLHHEP